LVSLAKSKLPLSVGEALISVLSDLLSNPTEDQARVLACWCRTFIGAQLMKLDPTLNQFQLSKLSNKYFILDTDCVLDAIVTDSPKSEPELRLIKTLIELGCKVVIPIKILNECINHAAYSMRTFNYFCEAGSYMSAEFIEAKVQNVFVKGFFYGLQNGTVRQETSYQEYLSNYYEPRDAQKFLGEVIETILPEGVQIASMQELAGKPLPEKKLKDLNKYFLEELSKSRKAEYRTIKQTMDLAATDAELFLLVNEMTRRLGSDKDKVLGGNVYLVTESRHYRNAGEIIGSTENLTVKIGSLHALTETVGASKMSDKDTVLLFENPFLGYSVDAVWNDVQKLVRAGVSTVGKRMARLRRDLDQALHQYLTMPDDQIVQDLPPEEAQTDVFIKMVTNARQRGYRLTPTVDAIVELYEKATASAQKESTENKKLKEQLKTVSDRIAEFGKRKRRYLRKFTRVS